MKTPRLRSLVSVLALSCTLAGVTAGTSSAAFTPASPTPVATTTPFVSYGHVDPFVSYGVISPFVSYGTINPFVSH
jgi:hypothetical protein